MADLPPAQPSGSPTKEELPCGHTTADLILVDERELRCHECGCDVNDDTWVCGVCYRNGETERDRRLDALERALEAAGALEQYVPCGHQTDDMLLRRVEPAPGAHPLGDKHMIRAVLRFRAALRALSAPAGEGRKEEKDG